MALERSANRKISSTILRQHWRQDRTIFFPLANPYKTTAL